MTADLHVAACPDCDWTSQPSTPGRAKWRLRRHGCAARKALTATRRDCEHEGRHVHGTVVAYISDRCRCPDCRRAVAADRAEKLRDAILGNPAHVDPGPVLAHIARLRAIGIGCSRIAELSGVPDSVVAQMPKRKQVHRDTAAKILAVRADAGNRAPGVPVDPTGTRRRIQALAALGWPCTEIERQAGLYTNFALRAATGGRGVTEASRLAIAAVYDRLWDLEPPTGTPQQRAARTRSLHLAERHGWVVPQYWDDDEIDNPQAAPRVAVAHVPKDRLDIDSIEQCLRGDSVRLSREERLVVSGRLRDVGYSARQIAARVERTERQVQRDLAEIEANAARTGQVA